MLDRLCVLISAAILVSCTDAGNAPACTDPAACLDVPYTVADHEGIASEDGLLTLTSGRVAVERISLFEGDREVVWLQDQVIELGGSGGQLLAAEPIPPGTYDRIEIVLAPLSPTVPTFEASIVGESWPAIDVYFDARVVGERFPVPALEITAESGDAVELPISLLSLFFYTWPYADSEDGVFRPVGIERDQTAFEQNLLNLFAPRLIP